MGQYRIERLSLQLQQEIATMLIRHEIKDPRVNEFLTVNRVEVAGDLSYAKVYVSSFMDDSSVKKGVEGLQSAAGFIQSTIAKKISTYISICLLFFIIIIFFQNLHNNRCSLCC